MRANDGRLAPKKKNNKKKKNPNKSKPAEDGVKAPETPQNGELRDEDGDQSDDHEESTAPGVVV
jgi:hypothetical protein